MVIRRRRTKQELEEGSQELRNYDMLARKLPVLDWLPLYSKVKFRSDMIAGLTIGLMVVPQSLAYAANIAELPARYGLYSSYVGVILYTFLGTSKDVTLGPTAIMSKIVEESTGSSTAECDLYGDFASASDCSVLEHPACCEAVVKAAELCVLGGGLQLMMGLLDLGVIVDFISIPVLYGFTTSASLTIAAGQVHSLIGIPGSKGTGVFSKFPNIFYDTFATLGTDGRFGWKWPDMIIAAVCIGTAIYLQRTKARMDRIETKLSDWQRFAWFVGAAGNFFTVALGTVIGAVWSTASPGMVCSHGHTGSLNTTSGVVEHGCLTLTGYIAPGLPAPTAPAFKDGAVSELIPGAVLVALIGYLESIAIAKSFARANGYDVVPSQELVAIGVGNLFSSFFHSFPITGSFSRTAVNSASGVATPLSGLVTGSIVMIALLLLTSMLQYVPKAALSSIIIVAVLKLFNYTIVRKMWAVDKLELLPWGVSFFGCTFLSIQVGVGIGAVTNLLILCYYAAQPGGGAGYGGIRPRFVVADPDRATRVVGVGGSVLYPAANLWKDHIQAQLDGDGVAGIVLDLALAERVDYTCIQALTEIAEDCAAQGVVLELANTNNRIAGMLLRAGFFENEKFRLGQSRCAQPVSAAVLAAEISASNSNSVAAASSTDALRAGEGYADPDAESGTDPLHERLL